jgi:hypothetical protein
MMSKLPAIRQPDRGNIRFRRIHGRIVPLAIGTGVSAGIGGAITALSKKKGMSTGPDKRYLAASYATQVASGLLSAIPMKNKWGYAATIGGSFALDALAASLVTKSVWNMKGSRYQKAKVFAEQQAIGGTIGWGTFGAALLGQKSVRTSAVRFATKYLSKIRGIL